MLIPNHPDDERLSALASGDPDATADGTLVDHVSACARCAGLVDELGLLRASLAELPDLSPSRPLRLVPEMADAPSRADRLGGWVRRLFGPVVATGAAAAMVGLVGTASPALAPMGGGDSLSVGQAESSVEADTAGGEAPAAAATDGGDVTEGLSDRVSSSPHDEAEAYSAEDASTDDQLRDAEPTADRSVWPMVLFLGIAVMVGAGLMRWIFVPRDPSGP